MVMEIDGYIARLNHREQAASRLPGRIPVDEIDMQILFGAQARDEYALMEMTGDDHEHRYSDRVTISPDAARLERNREVLIGMAGQLIAHKAEIYLARIPEKS